MPKFDAAVGRYVYLTIDDVEYRVYFEETGHGIPLLLQHTAGADARQWRHLLEDVELQAHFRLIAYDLPYHAKSVPPISVEWRAEEYRSAATSPPIWPRTVPACSARRSPSRVR